VQIVESSLQCLGPGRIRPEFVRRLQVTARFDDDLFRLWSPGDRGRCAVATGCLRVDANAICASS
jgi:hypothetical protein